MMRRLDGLTDDERARKADRMKARLPAYVIDRVETVPEIGDHTRWMRAVLAHPDGRATGGESCVWCGDEIEPDVYWLFRDQHACGASCQGALKRSMRRYAQFRWDEYPLV